MGFNFTPLIYLYFGSVIIVGIVGFILGKVF